MLGDISDLRRSTLSAATPICGNPLTDSVPLSRISLRWIRRPVHSSFSVEEDGQDQSLVPGTGWLRSDL